MIGTKNWTLILSVMLSALCLSPLVTADDTEIFYGQSADSANTNPNILFILDTSGSMGYHDGGNESRMDKMKQAMTGLLEQSSSYNVGFMGFSGTAQGGSIRYPIDDLEAESTEACPGGVCPDEILIVRPASSNDDATQSNTSLDVTLDSPSLTMPIVPNSTVTAGPTGTEVSNTAIAVSSVSEAEHTSTGAISRTNDAALDEWFIVNPAHDYSRYGYRFENIEIPAGATVTTAKIVFTHNGANFQKGDISAYLTAEAATNPDPYHDGTNAFDPLADRFDNISTTNELVSWTNMAPSSDGTNPSVDQKIETADIRGLLTELAGLPGWVGGNPVSILIEPFETYIPSNADKREVRGVTAASAEARPVLHYTYSEDVETTLNTTVLTAVAHVDEITAQNTGEVSRNEANEVSSLFFAGALNEPRKLALRFEGADIPAGAVIKTARLSINSADTAAVPDPETNWTVDPTTAPTTTTTTTGPDPTAPTVPTTATTPTLSMNINAELTGSPLPYSSDILSGRTMTTDFQTWPDIEDTPGTTLVSPDFADVIQEATNATDWAVGSSYSVVLTAPATHSNIASNTRELLTSSSATKPMLTITWEADDGSGGVALETQTTALRFPNVNVPPGATIKSAELIFRSNAASDTETTVDISGEDIGNSIAFSSTNNDIGARSRTTAREVWNIESWPTIGDTFESPNIERVVSEITDRIDWCGGNALTLFLNGNGSSSGYRDAVAYDQNPSQAPTLRIVYEPDSVTTETYCSNSSTVVSLVDGADDATENTDNDSVSLTNQILSTNTAGDTAQLLGLRFRGVKVPKNATVTSAKIELISTANFTENRYFEILIEDTDHAPPYQATSKNISDRNYTVAIVNWESGPVGIGESAITSDLTNLIEDIVERSDWLSGNAMSFMFKPKNDGDLRTFHGLESGEAYAARLIVQYEAERSDAGTRTRDKIKREISGLVAQGGTPIVDAYYEAAQYYRGGSLKYGKKRGRQYSSDRYHRVSHPDSYINGTVNRSSGCTDTDLDDYDCVNETIGAAGTTEPSYISPIESQCQQNHIVLLSDGAAQSISSETDVQSLIGSSCTLSGTGSYNGNEMCGRELAKWLYDTDHDPIKNETQNVTTHTIGFNISDPKFLQDIATAGKGQFYPATSAAELLTAFKNIFINVSKTDTTFVAPSATVSQANRMKHREDVYFSLFKPEGTARWAGNLKKYKVRGDDGANAELIDANDNVAIDPNTGEFKGSSKSFWSTVTDGGSVLLGGAAEKLENDGVSHLYRNVYTYTGSDQDLTDTTNELLPGNPDLDPTWFELPPLLAEDPDYYTDLVNWVHGQDIYDIDGDNDTNEARGEMGDPLHSQPLLLNYAGDKSIVYIATNEGFLHAVRHDTGKERYAFMPKELLKNASRFYQNTPTRKRPYGLDGGLTTWIQDTNNNGVIDAGEKAYLYIAMRRGGNNYYALDVSKMDQPKFMWSIKGGETTIDTDPSTADGNFSELSDTWSLPVKSKVRDGAIVRDVLIFGGGYDPNQDASSTVSTSTSTTGTTTTASSRSIDGVGRAIFIVDALTGEELWQTDGTYGMEYSIPSQVRVIDINLDGLADQLYVGDMGGQIWRMDIDNDSSNTDTLSQRMSGGKIAELADDSSPSNARRFYYPPDISIVNTGGRQALAISIGSGWRAHPLDNVVEDRFYSLRYKHVYTKPIDSFGNLVYSSVSESNLEDVTTNTPGTPLPSTAQGWYLQLEQPGEKILGSSVTADGNVLFTSYMPATSSGICSAAVGTGAVYAVSALNGDPVFNLDETGTAFLLGSSDRRRQLKHPGIPPETAVLFPNAGEATVLVGTETLHEIDIGEPRRRTFWQEALDDNL